jgi:hypothetical protein
MDGIHHRRRRVRDAPSFVQLELAYHIQRYRRYTRKVRAMRPSTAVSAPAGAHLPRDHTLCDRPLDVRLALDKREVDVDSNQVARIELVRLRHWQPRSAEIRPVDPSLGSQSRAP